MKPTQQEIDRMTHAFSSEYKRGFEDGIETLLNWQETQPLKIWCVMVGECEILDVCRTLKAAEKSLDSLKNYHPIVKFWIDERTI